jgi:MFS family permease
LSLRAGCAVLSRMGLARLTARFGRRAILTVSIGAAAVAVAVLPVLGVPGAAVAMVVLGFGLGTPQPLTMSWVVSLADREHHGTALGLRLTANNVAQISLPVVITAVAGPFGVAGVLLTTAAVLAVSLLLVAPFREDG